jgi:ferritin-like metal-binding protein YciE
MDAAIIGCAQKIEHLEIAGYGTARTYAEQLGLTEVAQLLQQTLMEEHDADERLTKLAVQRVNQEAEASATANR